MSATRDDVQLIGSWVSAYASTGIASGSEIYITNKSPDEIFICIGTAAPTDNTKGYPLRPYDSVTVEAGESDVWVYGHGRVLIQD